jgi:hypothetical protein
VKALYAHFLRRDPDSGGVAFFTNLLQMAVPNEAVEAMIVGSDEYFGKT